MSEYVVNPRRAPRAPARCTVLVNTADGAWNAQSEDIGPMGCQLVAPRSMARGLPLTMVFANPKVAGSLQVEGRVAWCSAQAPWRLGVAFVSSSREQVERWFALLVAAHPGVGSLRRVPERLPIDAMIFLAPPPTFLLDFTDDEVAVLRHVASGTTIASLRERLGGSWSALQRAMFSLLARGVVTLSKGASAHPTAWKKAMEEMGIEFAPEAPRAVRPAPFSEAPALADEPPPDADVEFELVPGEAPPAPSPTPSPPPLPPERPPPLPRPASTVPGGASAGTGWRGGSGARSQQAQEALDLARSELVAGRSASGLDHLRRALRFAPGDPEIAAELVRAMTKG